MLEAEPPRRRPGALGYSSGTFIQSAMASNRLTLTPLPLPGAAASISASRMAAWADMPQAMSQTETPTRPGPPAWPVIEASPLSAWISRS